jgi:tetratricopeptide (TPR) repeat protein
MAPLGHWLVSDVPGGWLGPTNKAVAGSGSVAVAGNQNIVIVGGNAIPVAREVAAHQRQVSDRYRIGALQDRDVELRELTDFLAGTGSGWWGWHGDAWTGKTRLIAEIACAPPTGWRAVAFFVRRGGGDNTQAGFLRSVIPQLASIAGLEHVELGDHTAQVALLGELLEAAIAACATNGERLLLLIDGLDEDDTFTSEQFRSVLDVLPFSADRYVVVVSSRPNPQLRLPDHHPLRSSAAWRTLKVVPAAVAAERAAREDMAALLQDPIGRQIAALLEATGYPLTARNLASLTRTPVAEVARIFDRSSGRSFTPVPSSVPGEPGYVFGHVTLQQMLIEHLNPDAPHPSSNEGEMRIAWAAARETALAPWKAHVRDWGRGWAQKQWPLETPDYALDDSFPQLLDDESLIDVLTDPHRHARIQSRFGSLAPALAQLRAHLGRFFPDWQPETGTPPPTNLERIGRLLFALHDLTSGGGRVPSRLPSVFVRVGDHRTAERLIEAGENPIEALARMAVAYRDIGDTGRSLQLVDRFLERLPPAGTLSPNGAEWCARIAALCAEAGDVVRSTKVAQAIEVTAGSHQNTVTAAVVVRAAAGDLEDAVHLAEKLSAGDRFRALHEAALTCFRTGASAAATRLADAACNFVDEFTVDKHGYAIAAVRLYAHITETTRAHQVASGLTGGSRLGALIALAESQADRRDTSTARVIAIEASHEAAQLATSSAFLHRDLPALAAILIRTGADPEAQHVLELCGREVDRAGHALVAAACYATGQPGRAYEHVVKARANDPDAVPWIRIYDLEKLIDHLLPVAPTDAVDEVMDEFTDAVLDAADDLWVRRATVRAAVSLATHGRLKDALPLINHVRQKEDRLADEGHIAVAHALAAGPQWADTYTVLRDGEPSAQDLAEVADTLARNRHIVLACDLAALALTPARTAPPLVEPLTEVAYALASSGDFETALAVAAEEPALGRYRARFLVADAASRRDPSATLRLIDALDVDDYTRMALLTGSANAALAHDRHEDAAAALTRAADLIRAHPGQSSEAITDIACLHAYTFGAATAPLELITSALPVTDQYGPVARVAGVLMHNGQPDEARTAAALALTQARSIHDERQRTHALSSLACTLADGKLSDIARSAADDGRALFEASPPPDGVLKDSALSMFVHTASAVAEAQARVGRLTRAVDVCEQIRAHGGQPDLHEIAPALAVGGHTSAARDLLAQIPAQNQGQPLDRVIAAVAGADLFDEALACLEDVTDPGQRSAGLNHIASRHAAQDRPEDAQRFAKQAVEQAQRAGSHVRPEQLLNAAQTFLAIGQENEARKTAMTAAGHLFARQSFGSSTLILGCAQLLQRTGDRAVSRRLLAEAWRVDGHPFKGWGLLADLDDATALALARGRWSRSEERSRTEAPR